MTLVRYRFASMLAPVVMLIGCATPGSTSTGGDPYESFNRKVFAFNDALDSAVIRPVATAYATVVPSPVQTCVRNVFGNLSDVVSGANSCLQGKGGECAATFMRVATNTVLGIGGCIDIASSLPGLQRKQEDFGQTLAVWGVPSGPYLVLPIFGASTVRDAGGTVVGTLADPMRYLVTDTDWFWGLTALRAVSGRADLLDASKLLDNVALDRYAFVRDAYIQRRVNQIYDGSPPDVAPPSVSGKDDHP